VQKGSKKARIAGAIEFNEDNSAELDLMLSDGAGKQCRVTLSLTIVDVRQILAEEG
jgi:hypothetical protein